jgi:molybdenum cofactor cytidylyltransferase
VVLPTFEGQRGHPVGFSTACRDELMGLRGNKGAAPVVIARGAMKLVVSDAGAVTDIDTLDDLNWVAQLLARKAISNGACS